jgi:hypothetical protein
MKLPTLEETADWIIHNRTRDAFKDYDKIKIVQLILSSLQSGVFTYHLDENGKLNGIVCGEVKDGKTVFITDILITHEGVLKVFMKRFLNKYKGFRIEGLCRGKTRIFNDTTKLNRRIK